MGRVGGKEAKKAALRLFALEEQKVQEVNENFQTKKPSHRRLIYLVDYDLSIPNCHRKTMLLR